MAETRLLERLVVRQMERLVARVPHRRSAVHLLPTAVAVAEEAVQAEPVVQPVVPVLVALVARPERQGQAAHQIEASVPVAPVRAMLYLPARVLALSSSAIPSPKHKGIVI